MSRAFLTAVLSAAILVAFAVPTSLPDLKGLSGSAQAGYSSDRKAGSDTKPSVKKHGTSTKKKGNLSGIGKELRERPYRPDAGRRNPAGRVDSDPGSEGSKPVKGGKK